MSRVDVVNKLYVFTCSSVSVDSVFDGRRAVDTFAPASFETDGKSNRLFCLILKEQMLKLMELLQLHL